MPRFDLIATTTFGLEYVVARELQNLGYTDTRTSDGRVLFSGDEIDIARCNLWLRSADRVLIRMGEFPAPDFGVLFDRITDLPWNEILPVDAQFPVKGRSVRSQLRSVPKVQAATKKAIVENLKRKHNRFRFDESGAEYVIEVSLLRDVATLTIDTTGPGLHKRGYREVVGPAPLRETMAAGLIQLSYWNRERSLIDPFCGSGTIPIEAAMIGRNIAPGNGRSFACEDWAWFERRFMKEARTEAKDKRLPALPIPIRACDHDPSAIRLARHAVTEAGVSSDIRFEEAEISALKSSRDYGCIITNPPYGERLGDAEEVEAVYRVMGRVFEPLDTWSVYVLTSNRYFEKHFGRRAPRRRKLYSGRLECQFYQYPGPPPPRNETEDDPTHRQDSHTADTSAATDPTAGERDASNSVCVAEDVAKSTPSPAHGSEPAATDTVDVVPVDSTESQPGTPPVKAAPVKAAPRPIKNPLETFVSDGH